MIYQNLWLVQRIITDLFAIPLFKNKILRKSVFKGTVKIMQSGGADLGRNLEIHITAGCVQGFNDRKVN